MTERVWTVVEGYYGRGLSAMTIANKMGITVHNVKAALREARTILQNRLKGWKP
jgi:DNA-directed RNA polymerase specialized sigma24 family protein